jgi:hypothetical protein
MTTSLLSLKLKVKRANEVVWTESAMNDTIDNGYYLKRSESLQFAVISSHPRQAAIRSIFGRLTLPA